MANGRLQYTSCFTLFPICCYADSLEMKRVNYQEQCGPVVTKLFPEVFPSLLPPNETWNSLVQVLRVTGVDYSA